MLIKPSINGKSNTGYREWDYYYYSYYSNYMTHYYYKEWTTPVRIRIGKMKYVGELTTTKYDAYKYYQSGQTYHYSSTYSHLNFKNLEENCSLYGNLLW